MAPGWVALLRGVNLGSRNKVPMVELREVFEAAGAEAVRTYIQSGNVLFEYAKPDAAKLEQAIADAFGVESTVVLSQLCRHPPACRSASVRRTPRTRSSRSSRRNRRRRG